eukprot:TRINITY_DN1592_c0_g2_i1.p1 TRINITY_DN1592_c0_g2~~TRINITY_DN1592_c0_g2_i1.p1  ORF type:complete len:649 (+),score=201.73 TRINITY_DN1592_c0_g2_i1:111-2057(+)
MASLEELKEESVVHFQKPLPKYHRIQIVSDVPEASSQEEQRVMRGLLQQLKLRLKYLFEPHIPNDAERQRFEHARVELNDGVFHVVDEHNIPLVPLPSASEFFNDLSHHFNFIRSGAAKTFCQKRLEILNHKYQLYEVLNWNIEEDSTRDDPVDFYKIAKVDNHIHLAAAMTSSHLLNFILDKFHTCPNDVVMMKDGRGVSLGELFSNLDVDSLTIDSLGVTGGKRMFHRFDYFNAAYNPFGATDMRNIFLKTENFQKGRYFAEISKEVYQHLKDQKHNVLVEPRLSIYGRTKVEWDDLADWFTMHGMHSENVAYMIQVPRIYSVFRRSDSVKSFGEMLDNIFGPLFEATLHPESNRKLSEMLRYVVAFDSVDDESSDDSLLPPNFDGLYPNPDQWTSDQQPPYSFYAYYMWANLYSLNRLREARGLSTFAFRPHCGEAGPIHHLCTAFLLARSINHGIRLAASPSLTYLYYLSQLGMSISPLSNNTLFCPLSDNPFRQFFNYGLNVTLSTDDPLQFHSTDEPLLEEYAIAKQFWRLSVTDLSEIARNSVLQSGFSHERKKHMLGDNYTQHGIDGNDISKTNIADCRVHFRYDNLHSEIQLLLKHSSDAGSALHSIDEEAESEAASWQDALQRLIKPVFHRSISVVRF